MAGKKRKTEKVEGMKSLENKECLYTGCDIIVSEDNRYGYCWRHARTREGEAARQAENDEWNRLREIHGPLTASEILDERRRRSKKIISIPAWKKEKRLYKEIRQQLSETFCGV